MEGLDDIIMPPEEQKQTQKTNQTLGVHT
jgi:hypothetical protein